MENTQKQRVTKGRRLSWLTVIEYSCAHRAQINFGDPTLYLTYAENKIEVLTWQGWRLRSPIAS